MKSPPAAVLGPVTVAALRHVHSLHAKSVCLVSARRANETVGITIDSFVSISLDPPLVGFFVGEERTILSTLLAADTIAVNVLTSDQEHIARRLATSGSEIVRPDELEDDQAGVELGTPVIRDALAILVGHVQDAIALGDHILIVLQVKQTMACNQEIDRDITGVGPLLFFRSTFAAIEESRSDQFETGDDL